MVTCDGNRYAESRKRLREAGFTDPQAEAVIAAVQAGAKSAAFATKRDLDEVRSELKVEIREAELRLEAKVEVIRSDMRAMKADHEPGLRPDPRCAHHQHRGDGRSRDRRGSAGRTLRRREFLLAATAAAASRRAGGQEVPKSAHIGFIVTNEAHPRRHFDEAMARLD